MEKRPYDKYKAYMESNEIRKEEIYIILFFFFLIHDILSYVYGG